MTPPSPYRSPEGEAVIRALYDKQLAALPIATEHRTVDTRFGTTHVLVAGPEAAPPLLLVHGANHSAPANLASLLPLASSHRVYAPDTVGQSVASAPTYISPRGNGYGLWLADVLDGLGLPRLPVIAGSFGAGIVLRLAAYAPERITQAALIVPSGIANGSILRMIRELFIPWLLYGLAPSQRRLVRACQPMMSEMDGEFLEFVGAMLRHQRVRPEGPKLTSKAELQGFTAPVLLFVAEEDVFFPAERVVPQARRIFPNLVAIERIPGRHMPARETWRLINERILRFLESGGSGG